MRQRKYLIALREKMNLTQRQVAKAINITTSYYGMIEQGVRTPKLDIAIKIADFFGTNVKEIFFDNLDNKASNTNQTA
ncbi:MAG: helix-turn-helix transcriptional regulator [Clostridiales bacterium]|nr:helix-turn-helix transcriptional regulator [Clostridiales bacterium]